MFMQKIRLRISFYKNSEAALQKCSQEKVFWKYAANLQENTHAEVTLQLYWTHTSAWVFSCKIVI